MTLVGLLILLAGSVKADMPQEFPVVGHTVGGVTVQLQFLNDHIVQVRRFPEGQVPAPKSYSVVLDQLTADIHTHSDEQAIHVYTHGGLAVSIDKATGLVTFKDGERVLLRESSPALIKPCEHKVDEGKFRVAQSWALDKEEDVYGLGQLHDEAMSWRGREMELWNHNTYIAIPYITTSRGYGIYWDNAGRSSFKSTLDAEGQTVTLSSEVATCVNYYFMYDGASHDRLMALVRQLGGQATMFPLWAMGHWQCRERYKTSDELAAVLDKYRELRIPLDAIVQDWQYWGCDSNWNAMRFQNPYYINKVGDKAWEKYLPNDLKNLPVKEPRLKSPQEMVDYVHSNNAHLMISIWASFGPWTEPYRELKEIGALLPFDTWPRNQGVLPYDPFNPQARDIYWRYLKHLSEMGFDAWWTDSTEPDHFEKPGDDDYLTHDGSWRSVKNAFPLMTNGGIYTHQRAMQNERVRQDKNYPEKRLVQMTRSGAFGLQRYGSFSWSGDVVASWKEMKNQIPSGLNYVLCGIPFWNTDLGGFFYWEYEQTPKNPAVQELQTRWMQWGTFMPLMRNHCSSPMVSEIYEFGQPGDWAYDAMVAAVRLRYRLLPYIYAQAGAVVHHSGMMMRPLVMDYPDDVKARRLNDEYMFGNAMLVKPVTDPMFTYKDEQKRGHLLAVDQRPEAAVNVYLPKGLWYDFITHNRVEGGRDVKADAPIDHIPVFVRAGSIVPFGPDVQYSSEKPWDDLEIRVYPGADGQFTLYEDAGDGYGYERGEFSEITFNWDDAQRQLTIGGRKGKFKGMLKKRTFRLVLIGGQDTRGDYPLSPTKTIEYGGRLTRVSL